MPEILPPSPQPDAPDARLAVLADELPTSNELADLRSFSLLEDLAEAAGPLRVLEADQGESGNLLEVQRARTQRIELTSTLGRQDVSVREARKQAAVIAIRQNEFLRVSLALDTSDLGSVAMEDLVLTERVLDDARNPGKGRGVRLEVATDLGVEAWDLAALAPLAGKLGRPVLRNGIPDLAVLAEPKTSFFLALLATLVDAYNVLGPTLPTRRAEELPLEELRSLFSSFETRIAEQHPDLTPHSQHKAGSLKEAATAFLDDANRLRLESGSQLFEKTLPELDSSPPPL